MTVFHTFDNAVIILYDKKLAKTFPSIESALGSHVRIVGKECLCFGRVFFQQFGSSSLNAFLRFVEGCLQLCLSGTHVAHHQVITGINHIGHPVENPESGVPGENDVIGAVHTGVAYGNLVRTAVYGRKYRHVGIICAEPQYSTDRVGQLGAHLCHEYETALLGGDGTFIEVFLVTHLEREWRKAVRGMIRACAEIFADVERSTFIMVAHGVLHILHGNLAVGLHKQRHRSVRLTQYIRQELVAAVGKHIEIAPYACLAIATGTEIERSIGIGKAEILVHTVKIALLACKGDDIGGVHTVLLVVHVELMNAALVGMSGDTIIGHADSYPYGTAHTGSLANHLHNPYFVGVGDGEGLATAVIAIFLHQFRHHFDGLAGGA